MSEKPEALRLADDPTESKEMYLFMQAAELRRLHADNERLKAENEALRRDAERDEVERLREVLNRFEYSSDGHIKRYPEEEEVIAALRREDEK